MTVNQPVGDKARMGAVKKRSQLKTKLGVPQPRWWRSSRPTRSLLERIITH